MFRFDLEKSKIQRLTSFQSVSERTRFLVIIISSRLFVRFLHLMWFKILSLQMYTLNTQDFLVRLLVQLLHLATSATLFYLSLSLPLPVSSILFHSQYHFLVYY